MAIAVVIYLAIVDKLLTDKKSCSKTATDSYMHVIIELAISQIMANGS